MPWYRLVPFLLLASVPPAPVAGQDASSSWAGTDPKTGAAVAIHLTLAGTKVTGTVVVGRASYPVSGTALGDLGVIGKLGADGRAGKLEAAYEAEQDRINARLKFNDPATGKEDRSRRMDLRLARQAEVAAAPSGAADGAATAPAGPGGTSALARQWDAKLRGRRLYHFETYSGGLSGGSSRQETVDLCTDGRFVHRSDGLTTIDVPGASASAGGSGATRGTWRIVDGPGYPVLEAHAGGRTWQFAIGWDDQGRTYFNRVRWMVQDPAKERADCR